MDQMALLQKPFEDITETDIQVLVDDQVSERKAIEYKSTLPGPRDRDKREFLADVSSFANASGGVILYGVPERKGVPQRPIGLQIADPDAEVRRLDSMIQSAISPRIPGVGIRAIPLQAGDTIIVVRVPRSWALPHRVVFQGHDKFYSRNSGGKYELDVQQLRAAFLLSENVADRARAFRQERLARIVAEETPAPLTPGPKMILHLVPFGAFDAAVQVNLHVLTQDRGLLQPIGFGFTHQRFNLDGLLTYNTQRDEPGVTGYLQVFRNGCIEAADAYWVRASIDKPLIPSVAYEEKILGVLPKYLEIEKRLGMQPPTVLMLTLHEVKGHALALGCPFRDVSHTIDRDTLVIPEVVLEDLTLSPDIIMKPIFDAVWNAAGLAASMNYDATGKWVGRS